MKRDMSGASSAKIPKSSARSKDRKDQNMQVPKYSLSEAIKGRRYIVTAINTPSAMRERLRALGLIEGTLITLREGNGKKGIASYSVRGAQIAFRRETAEGITVAESAAEHTVPPDPCKGWEADKA